MRTFAGVAGTTMQNFTSFVMLPVLLCPHNLKAQQVHTFSCELQLLEKKSILLNTVILSFCNSSLKTEANNLNCIAVAGTKDMKK